MDQSWQSSSLHTVVHMEKHNKMCEVHHADFETMEWYMTHHMTHSPRWRSHVQDYHSTLLLLLQVGHQVRLKNSQHLHQLLQPGW